MGTPLAIDDPRASEVLSEHRDRVALGRALRGSARVRLEGPDFKLNRPQRIAVAQPGRLRFEILGLFDVLAAMLVSDGIEFGLYEASTGEITRGPMTPALLWELAKLDLDAQEVVDLLLAAPVPSPDLARAGVWLENDAGITVAYAPLEADRAVDCQIGANADRLEAGRATCYGSLEDLARGGEIFRFDAHGLLREMRSIDSGWETRYQASFDDYADLEGTQIMRRFPMRITIRSPQVEAWARFDWKRVMLANQLPDRFFTIPARRESGG
jgi:hypothetical protein